MSYESPITIMHRQLANQINIQLEGEVVKAVMECNIDVNKDELIKALKYDRDQYVKGYEDGKADAMQWIPIKFRETTDEDGVDKEEYPIMLDCPLPDNGQEVFISTKAGYVMEDTFYDDDGAYLEDNDWDEVAAWMPLPEPYKESE